MFESIPLQFQILMSITASIISIYLVFRGFKIKAPYLLILAIFTIFLVCVLEILRKAITYHFLYLSISEYFGVRAPLYRKKRAAFTENESHDHGMESQRAVDTVDIVDNLTC